MSIAPPPAYPTWPPQPYPPAPQKPRRRWPAIAAAAGIGAIVAGSITTLISFAATSPEHANTAAPAPSTVTETAGPPPSPASLPVAEADAQTCRAWQTTDTLVTAATASMLVIPNGMNITDPAVQNNPAWKAAVTRASDLFGQRRTPSSRRSRRAPIPRSPGSPIPPSALCRTLSEAYKSFDPASGNSVASLSSQSAGARLAVPMSHNTFGVGTVRTDRHRDTHHRHQAALRVVVVAASGHLCLLPAPSAPFIACCRGGGSHGSGSRYHRPAAGKRCSRNRHRRSAHTCGAGSAADAQADRQTCQQGFLATQAPTKSATDALAVLPAGMKVLDPAVQQNPEWASAVRSAGNFYTQASDVLHEKIAPGTTPVLAEAANTTVKAFRVLGDSYTKFEPIAGNAHDIAVEASDQMVALCTRLAP